ncbi:hypothetical protein LSM04_002100 [Trypanosoma melophagium]|uniref:uncharacterized protein n=1 Tax=Trypanosoma melophagium TaxID=715481 RepID=UPI00351A6981|nr:hypothetical protein LSM04_002100 [Trypanosoma melophagium]
MLEAGNALKQALLPLGHHHHCNCTRNHSPTPTTFLKGDNAVVEWLEEISTAQGADRPSDVEGEELVAFFKERSKQRITESSRDSDGDSVSSSNNNNNNKNSKENGSSIQGYMEQWHQEKKKSEEEEEVNDVDDTCNPATRGAQLSPQITPTAIINNTAVRITIRTTTAIPISHHGKAVCESFCSVPQTGRSSQPCGVSASRMSGTAGAAAAADVNSSNCSSHDLWLPPPLVAELPVALGLTPAGPSVGSEVAGTTSIATKPIITAEQIRSVRNERSTISEGGDYTTPQRQRIPAMRARLAVPPPAPHRERCRRDEDTTKMMIMRMGRNVNMNMNSKYLPQFNSNTNENNGNEAENDREEDHNNVLHFLRLNHPPRLCPPYAEKLLTLAVGNTAVTRTTASS